MHALVTWTEFQLTSDSDQWLVRRFLSGLGLCVDCAESAAVFSVLCAECMQTLLAPIMSAAARAVHCAECMQTLPASLMPLQSVQAYAKCDCGHKTEGVCLWRFALRHCLCCSLRHKAVARAQLTIYKVFSCFRKACQSMLQKKPVRIRNTNLVHQYAVLQQHWITPVEMWRLTWC